MTGDRAILHVDMDAFFAAIEQLDAPALRGRPVIVGHDGPRGVVATASYEARVFGCHSAQPIAIARRLCPEAVIMPPRGHRYREVSQQVFQILRRFTPIVEPLSIDEAFLDVTGSKRLLGDAVPMARQIKQEIARETSVTASVGVAPNKFLAKIASDLHKPDGLTVITSESIDRILPPLPISRMWGVGPATEARLQTLGVRTFGDLRTLPRDILAQHFGKLGPRLYDLARGIDQREVHTGSRARSVSHEQTFARDLADPDNVRGHLLSLTERVAVRLRRHRLCARRVTVKIRFGDFQTITRSQTLSAPTDRTDPLWTTARMLFDEWAGQRFQPVRLIGVAAGHLEQADAQMGLFTDPGDDRQRRLDEAADSIRQAYGAAALRRGSTLREGR